MPKNKTQDGTKRQQKTPKGYRKVIKTYKMTKKQWKRDKNDTNTIKSYQKATKGDAWIAKRWNMAKW